MPSSPFSCFPQSKTGCTTWKCSTFKTETFLLNYLLLSVLTNELVLPDEDGLVPVGLAVPHPDVPLDQHRLAQQHNLGIGRYPRPGSVEDVDQLLDVFLDGQHVLKHNALAQQGLEVQVDQGWAWRHLTSNNFVLEFKFS